MIDRNQIETLLRIHGMGLTAKEEEIRSVLLSAKYNTEEIDTAITVLRENTVDQTSRVEGLHKIYRSDDSLAPSEVSALLGVDLDVTALEVRNHRSRGLTAGQNFIVIAIAMVLALSGILYAMYEHGTGPFHPSIAQSKG